MVEHVGHHFTHHIGHCNVVSTLCEVSETLTEWKSEKVWWTYGRTGVGARDTCVSKNSFVLAHLYLYKLYNDGVLSYLGLIDWSTWKVSCTANCCKFLDGTKYMFRFPIFSNFLKLQKFLCWCFFWFSKTMSLIAGPHRQTFFCWFLHVSQPRHILTFTDTTHSLTLNFYQFEKLFCREKALGSDSAFFSLPASLLLETDPHFRRTDTATEDSEPRVGKCVYANITSSMHCNFIKLNKSFSLLVNF